MFNFLLHFSPNTFLSIFPPLISPPFYLFLPSYKVSFYHFSSTFLLFNSSLFLTNFFLFLPLCKLFPSVFFPHRRPVSFPLNFFPIFLLSSHFKLHTNFSHFLTSSFSLHFSSAPFPSHNSLPSASPIPFPPYFVLTTLAT